MKTCALLACLWLFSAIGHSQYYFNKAATFGDGSYYTSFDESDFDYSGAITIEAWIHPDSISMDMVIVGKNYQTAYDFSLRQLSDTTSMLRFTIGGSFVNGTGAIPVGQWTHVAVSYNAAGAVAFYINGQPDPVSFGSLAGPIPVNNDNMLIGADHFFGAPGLFFQGSMDEVRIWNGVVPQLQIQNHMYVPFGLDNPGSIYNQREGFRMNMNAAGDTLKSECFPHHEMIPTNIQLLDLSNKLTGYADYNNHLVLDGTCGIGITNNISASDKLPGTSITAEIWARIDSNGTNPFMNFFNQSGGTNEYPWALYSSLSGEVFFELNAGVSGSISGGDIRDQQWHHIAGTYNGNTGQMVLYVDGQIVDSSTFDPATTVIAQETGFDWYVGTIGASSFASNKTQGNLDEARLWKNTVRTQSEIRKYMYTGLDAHINDPDIDSLVVFSFDGITRQSNERVVTTVPKLYGYFVGPGNVLFASSKTNNNNMPTSPLLRMDPSDYPQDFTMATVKERLPDNVSVVDTIVISGMPAGAITLLEAAVLLNHSYISDLEVYLYSPAGDSILMVASNGSGCNHNDLMTIFSASADSTYSSFCDFPITTPSSPTIRPVENISGVMTGNPNGIWRIRATDKFIGLDGFIHAWGLRLVGNTTSIPQQQEAAFATYNFPNPAVGTTTIYFELPETGDVSLAIFDQSGRIVHRSSIANAVAGANFHAMDISGFSAGIYYYELVSGSHRAVSKMVVGGVK